MAEILHGYTEFRDSGDENWQIEQGVINITRVFKGPWDKRVDFVNDVLIAGITDDNRYFGKPHPDYPQSYVDRITITGTGKTNQESLTDLIKHDRATITANYKTFPGGSPDSSSPGQNQNLGLLFFQEHVSTEVEILELPLEKIRINIYPEGGGNPIPVPHLDSTRLRKKITFMNYQVDIPFWINPNWNGADGILNNLGIINAATITTYQSGFSFPSDTLLFLGPVGSTKRELSKKNKLVWGMSLMFKYNPIGWHRYPTIDDSNPNSPEIKFNSQIDPLPYERAYFEDLMPFLFDGPGGPP